MQSEKRFETGFRRARQYLESQTLLGRHAPVYGSHCGIIAVDVPTGSPTLCNGHL